MNATELHEQKIKAKALLRRAEQDHKKGLVTGLYLAETRKHYQAIFDYNPDADSKQPEDSHPEPIEQGKQVDPNYLPFEVIQAIEKLKTQQNQIHAEKTKLCNELTSVPDEVNCKGLVDQILQLRAQWKNKADEVFAILSTGRLPEAEPDFNGEIFRQTLPQDAEKLRLRIQNLQSNIRKAEKRVTQSKTPVSQRQNQDKIVRWKMEIEQMRLQLSAI